MVTKFPRIGAVILAGGDVPATLKQFCSYRALLRLNGRYLLEYLLDALKKMPSVANIAIVAPEEALEDLSSLPGIKIKSGNTLVDNMLHGAEALYGDGITHCLFITGDLPLVTAEGLNDFISDGVESEAALAYPIIPREASERRFPGAKRTYVKLREGTFTGGNAFLTTAHLLDQKRELIQELYASRKDPLKLAKILGLGVVLRMLLGILTIPYLEKVATGLLEGSPARALITQHAEIGFDIDKADDLIAIERATLTTVPNEHNQ